MNDYTNPAYRRRVKAERVQRTTELRAAQAAVEAAWRGTWPMSKEARAAWRKADAALLAAGRAYFKAVKAEIGGFRLEWYDPAQTGPEESTMELRQE